MFEVAAECFYWLLTDSRGVRRKKRERDYSVECGEKEEKALALPIEVDFNAGQLAIIFFSLSLVSSALLSFHFSRHSLTHTMSPLVLRTTLFVFACSLSEGYDFFPVSLHRCQSIPANFSLCYGLGYTQMYLPNLLNHESVTEILYELPLWQSLLNLGCHTNARLLLCSVLAPVCLQQTPELTPSLVSFDNNHQESLSSVSHETKKFLYPCRSLCESVKQSCEARMVKQFGYKWPTMSKTCVHSRRTRDRSVPSL